jgi:hypothetical protein
MTIDQCGHYHPHAVLDQLRRVVFFFTGAIALRFDLGIASF